MSAVVKLKELIGALFLAENDTYLNKTSGDVLRLDSGDLIEAKSAKPLEEFVAWRRPRIMKTREFLHAKEGDWLLLPMDKNQMKHIKGSFARSLDDEVIRREVEWAAGFDPSMGVDRFHDAGAFCPATTCTPSQGHNGHFPGCDCIQSQIPPII